MSLALGSALVSALCNIVGDRGGSDLMVNSFSWTDERVFRAGKYLPCIM